MARFLLAALFLTLMPQSQASAETVQVDADLNYSKVVTITAKCGKRVHLSQKETQSLHEYIERRIAKSATNSTTLSLGSELVLHVKKDKYAIECYSRSLQIRGSPSQEPIPAPLSYSAQVG